MFIHDLPLSPLSPASVHEFNNQFSLFCLYLITFQVIHLCLPKLQFFFKN
jgi:hypothetical protein